MKLRIYKQMEFTKNNLSTTISKQPTSEILHILKTIMDNLNFGIVINDENFNILFINKYMSNFAKPPISEGQSCYKSLNSTGHLCDGCPIKNKTGRINPVSIEIVSANSKTFIVNIQDIILENGKKALLEIWVEKHSSENVFKPHEETGLQTQTENKHTNDQEIIESQRELIIQQDKLASMGKLVAGVAHEINNPIVFIRSNIEVLQKYWVNFQPAIFDNIANLSNTKVGNLSLDQMVKHVPDILQSMYRGTDRIKKIVSNLNSFARKNEGGFHKEKVYIDKVIDESLFLVHGQIKNKIAITNNIEKNLPYISGNFQRLEQVFVNLFINSFAAKATKILLNSKKEFNNIIIEVSDNGTGIPKNKIGKIFDPFFTTKGLSGTGLGLSISFGIVKEHDGSIHVASEEGNGTTFFIKLPFEAKTILVVDDDLIILDIIQKVLKICGFKVELSINGKEAIEKLERVNPSLVLTDIHMPEMDGFQLIDRIRNNKKYDKMPILVMSGVEKEIKKIKPLPIIDYITKPFSTKILAETVLRMVKDNN